MLKFTSYIVLVAKMAVMNNSTSVFAGGWISKILKLARFLVIVPKYGEKKDGS